MTPCSSPDGRARDATPIPLADHRAHIDAPLEVCEQRDVKGLYAKARRGEIKNFTGIDSDYERPELADVVLDTAQLTAEASADEIIRFLQETGRLAP